MAITRDDVLKALAGVTVDAAGTSLPASGRLSEIVIDPAGRVVFSIGIAPPEAKAFEAVRQAAEIAVLQLPGVKAALASLTAERGPGAGPAPAPSRLQPPAGGPGAPPPPPARKAPPPAPPPLWPPRASSPVTGPALPGRLRPARPAPPQPP
ncbi:iron-sulfur cluster assembly protein, partial [Methylobacterium platani]